MACINCHKKKVKCVFSNNNNLCDRCLGKQLCCEPHQSQQGRRTDLDMKEESRTSSDRNASHSKRSGLLDFGNSYDVLDDFSQGTRELWSISDHECQQGGRTDPDMEEESRTSSDHNASHLKRSGPLDFGNSYDVLDVFSQGTRGFLEGSSKEQSCFSLSSGLENCYCCFHQ
jgi:hypothetical protein